MSGGASDTSCGEKPSVDEIEALAAPALREQLAREAAADVHQQVVAERVGIVQAEDAVLAVQEDAGRDVVEPIVLLFFPEVPAEAAVDAMLRRDVVIDAPVAV